MVQLVARDISPDFRGVYALLKAQLEVEGCQSIFKSWQSEADRLDVKQKGLKDIATSIDNLCKDVDLATSASKMILNAQITFTKVMEDLLETTPDGCIGNISDAMAMADEIAMQSDMLSVHAASMTEQLKRLATMVENEDRKRKEKSIWQKFLEWLKAAFQAVVDIFTSVGAFVFTTLPSLSNTPLAIIAKSINNTADVSRPIHKNADDLTAFIHFLRYRIPNELQQAEESLTKFQYFHQLMKLDNARLTGSQVRMTLTESAQARREWREYRGRLMQETDAMGI